MNTYSLLVFTSMIGIAQSASALVFITSPGNGDLSFQSDSYTVGNRFQVGSDALAVTSLGLFDDGTPGLAQGHSVGLWRMDGTLLARVDFSPGLSGLSQGGFLYLGLANPVVLQPGGIYILGANYPDGTVDHYYANDVLAGETWSSAVTFINGRYTPSGSPFEFPALDVYGLSYVGANAIFEIVPEPATLSLLAPGLLAAAHVGCRFARRIPASDARFLRK